VKPLTGCSQDGVGWGKARCYCQARKKVQGRDEGVYKGRTHHPANRHDWPYSARVVNDKLPYRSKDHSQKEKAFPVLLQILAGQFDPNGKHTYGQNDSCDFESDCLNRLIVSITPLSWIEYIATVRTCVRQPE
jgi:hypothetical protein